MIFRAYYADGTIYQGGFNEWILMPESGVVFIVKYTSTGRTYYNGGDWYWADADNIYYESSGPWGTDKPKPETGCQSCIKQGVGVTDEHFKMICEQAYNDDNLYTD